MERQVRITDGQSEKTLSQIFSWELEGLTPAERFFHLAQGYIDSSQHLFRSLIDDLVTPTFNHALSAAFLFEHSIELFLKGAIIQSGKDPTNTHDLEKLYMEFRNRYPGKKFQFEGRIDVAVKPHHHRPHSEYPRYPIDKTGQLWRGDSHFTLETWVEQIDFFKRDYTRLILLCKEKYAGHSKND